jgi:hypothetical protein
VIRSGLGGVLVLGRHPEKKEQPRDLLLVEIRTGSGMDRGKRILRP